MKDYISRDAAMPEGFCVGVSCQECPFCDDPIKGGCKVARFIDAVPAADVAEVRHGRWEIRNWGFDYYCCSACGFEHRYEGPFAYCPNCGAKMDGATAMHENIRNRLGELARIEAHKDDMGMCRISEEAFEAIKQLAKEAVAAIEENERVAAKCRRWAKETKYDKYEDLVKRLRTTYEADVITNHGILLEAADAIEEMCLVAESNRRSAEAWVDTAGKAVAQIPLWIPVTERLPKAETDVLVTFDDGEVFALWQNWTAQDEHDDPLFYMTDPYSGAGHTVTHWMEMPSPPDVKGRGISEDV